MSIITVGIDLRQGYFRCARGERKIRKIRPILYIITSCPMPQHPTPRPSIPLYTPFPEFANLSTLIVTFCRNLC